MAERVALGPEHAGEVLGLYREYGWWTDRARGDVRDALANTPVAVGLRDGGDLVAAARVLTDGVYYAKVYDVIVAAGRRGEGLGRELMGAVVDHPALADMNLELSCREGLIPFYEACGFEEHGLTVEAADGEEALVTMAYWRERPDD